MCRLHRLLAELTPGGMRRELTANKAQALLARIRPADEVAVVRLHIARDHLAGIRALDARLKYIAADRRPGRRVGHHLMTLFGIGPVIAGRILAEAGDVARFATKDKFASYNGTAPIDVSSGDQVRHRLSRAGNRRINHALHMMAVTQIRYPGTAGRRYYERKRTEGKTPKEALRCLKRRLSDQVYRQLVARPAGQNRSVRITYDPAADAVYIHLTGERLTPRPHQHPRPPPPEASDGVHRPGLERRPPRRHRDPRRQQPPAPRPPRGSRNHQLTRPPAALPDPAPVRRSCPGCQRAASVKAGAAGPARRGSP